MGRPFDGVYMAAFYDRYGEAAERIFRTGELDRETNNGHEMKMYRWSELSDLCQRHGELVAGAAANFLAASHDPAPFETLSEEEWDQLVSFELRLCREPGVLDAGTHLLAAITRGSDQPCRTT